MNSHIDGYVVLFRKPVLIQNVPADHPLLLTIGPNMHSGEAALYSASQIKAHCTKQSFVTPIVLYKLGRLSILSQKMVQIMVTIVIILTDHLPQNEGAVPVEAVWPVGGMKMTQEAWAVMEVT